MGRAFDVSESLQEMKTAPCWSVTNTSFQAALNSISVSWAGAEIDGEGADIPPGSPTDLEATCSQHITQPGALPMETFQAAAAVAETQAGNTSSNRKNVKIEAGNCHCQGLEG